MIKYTLQCSNGHRFDAWFSNSQGCDDQISRGLVVCADCTDAAVVKAPMAPSITGSAKRNPIPLAEPPNAGSADVQAQGGQNTAAGKPETPADASAEIAMAGQVREALHMLRRFVEKNADNVGDKFAEEARKIHYGETEERGIYGETTPEEAEELLDEGVPFGRMPWPSNDT